MKHDPVRATTRVSRPDSRGNVGCRQFSNALVCACVLDPRYAEIARTVNVSR
ncbi:hypothetical protein WN48_08518 [Eufriesea mexicana]|uniref:Uncharacterized protein n=1 Tax=Eufriesea mexicana TaxID=516756 RepID=A0A310SJD4_9HYME|nr:hypothetical protein WN48_08518 [Eufriesea mexicana]